jgi:hypothetical protein
MAETSSFETQGHNLIGKSVGCTGFSFSGAGTDLVRPEPKLGALGHNGGPTETIPLLRGSPAIGRAGSDAPGKDQRGRRRDRRPDIGAFERLG